MLTTLRLSRVGACWDLPFQYACCEAYWIPLWCCLKLTSGCAVSGASWEWLGVGRVCCFWGFLGVTWCRQCQTLPVTNSGQPVCSYNMISTVCGCLCCIWVWIDGPTCAPRPPLQQHHFWGQFSKNSKSPQGPPSPASTCQLPVRLSLWKSFWWYLSCMTNVLIESPGRGKWCSPDYTSSTASASAGSEVTWQMPLGIPQLPATCQVPADLCGGVKAQGVIRLRQEGYIRPQKTKIWSCERKTLYWLGMWGKNGPQLIATQLSLSQILQDPKLSKARLLELTGWG